MTEDDVVAIAKIEERTLHIMVTLKQLSDLVQSNYVTKEAFNPVRSIVYGMMGFLGIAVLSAVVGGIIVKVAV